MFCNHGTLQHPKHQWILNIERVKISAIVRSAHTVYLCVLCGSENKQLLFPYTTLTECFYNRDLTPVASGYYMYRQFNIQQLYVLPTQCIYVFCVDLRTNSDYFPIQH